MLRRATWVREGNYKLIAQDRRLVGTVQMKEQGIASGD
jgi:hypothetical protein